MTARPKPIVLLPLPADVRLFTDTLESAQREWRRAGRHRKTMTMSHVRQEVVAGVGEVLAVYDAPVPGTLTTPLAEAYEAALAGDARVGQTVLQEHCDGPDSHATACDGQNCR